VAGGLALAEQIGACARPRSIAPQRLSQKSHEGPLSCPLRSGAALKRDMDLAYGLVVVARAEATPSPDGAGLAPTRTADKIRRLLRLRPASRSAEHRNSNAFAAQAAAHKKLVMKFRLSLVRLMHLLKDNRRLAT
jgi:hypothetical protein